MGNEMGCTALMFACAAWSPSYVKKLLDEKADPNLEDSNGVRPMNIVLDEIRHWEDATEIERIDCRERRQFMDDTGFLVPDRPNVEELEPFNKMDRPSRSRSFCWRLERSPERT